MVGKRKNGAKKSNVRGMVTRIWNLFSFIFGSVCHTLESRDRGWGETLHGMVSITRTFLGHDIDYDMIMELSIYYGWYSIYMLLLSLASTFCTHLTLGQKLLIETAKDQVV